MVTFILMRGVMKKGTSHIQYKMIDNRFFTQGCTLLH